MTERYGCSNSRITRPVFVKCVALAIAVMGCSNYQWSATLHEYIKTQDTSGDHIVSLPERQSKFFRLVGESLDPQSKTGLIPLFITKDGRLLCPKIETHPIDHRLKYFSDMIRSGLATHHQHIVSKYAQILDGAFPLVLMGGDDNDCDVTKHTERWDFPRLTWSVPSQIHQGNEWCNAIGVPTYEIWRRFGNANMSNTIENNDLNYPWSEKFSKVGWRGSPTRYNKKYLRVPFEDIPRAKLGKVSLENPEIIDAALTRIPEGFENATDKSNPKTRLASRIPFDDFMKYKGKLCCSNFC